VAGFDDVEEELLEGGVAPGKGITGNEVVAR